MFNMIAAQGYVIKAPHVGMAGQVPVTHVTVSVQTSTVRDEQSGYYPSQIMEVSYFGSLAAVAANYLGKGSLLTFSGVFRGVQTYVREDASISTTVKVDGQQLQLPPRAAAEPEAPAAAPAAPAPAPAPEPAQPVVGRIGRRRTQPADGIPPEAFAG